MKPFNSVNDAMQWITTHAKAEVEVFVFTTKFIMGGKPWDGVSIRTKGKSGSYRRGQLSDWCFW